MAGHHQHDLPLLNPKVVDDNAVTQPSIGIFDHNIILNLINTQPVKSSRTAGVMRQDDDTNVSILADFSKGTCHERDMLAPQFSFFLVLPIRKCNFPLTE